MTIKDKLNLMDEIKAANESRVKAFLQESKTVKHWKADYAVICNGVYEEDSFIISAVNIPYDRWMKFMWKLFLIWAVTACIMTAIAQGIHLGPM